MAEPSTQPKRFTQSAALVVAALLVLALAPLALLVTQAPWLRWLAIMSLAWWLPGALLVAHWRLRGLDLLDAAVLAAALGLCWLILVALLVHWLPGPISLWFLVAAYELGAIALLAGLYWRRPLRLEPASTSTWAWAAGLLLLAALLRLPGLGYHELHIDEVEVLTRARWAIQGVDHVLAVHSKGPGEIMVAMVVYRALGTINEATGRLPFAALSIASVLTTAVVGRRLFSPATGVWAGVLLILNGFALGLSRIVQYQPAVLLLSAVAVLAAWEFAQRGKARWLAMAVLLSAVGCVLHYEFVLIAPVLLTLTWFGWRRAPDRRPVVLTALVGGLAGAALVAAAYVPILLDPHFAGTQKLLGTRLGSLGAFNIPFFVEMGTFYNSIYFFAGLLALVVAGLVVGLSTRGATRRRTLLLILWFAPALILHLFVMDLPGTHFYLFMGCWSLLAALPLASITGSRSLRPEVRGAIVALVVAWLAVSAGYLYLVFFQQIPEYVANYREARVPLYWTPYGEQVPREPRFGFPIQEGWKSLGTLAAWGCLAGSYATNEGSRFHEGWYLAPLDLVKFEEAPDWIFVARHQQALHSKFDQSRLDGYQRAGEVRVGGEPRIEIWARAVPEGGSPLPVPYVVYQAEDFSRVFDQAVPALAETPTPAPHLVQAALDGAMVLESAGLEPTSLKRGDLLHLRLVWQLLEPLDADYKLFVHLAGQDGQPVAQWDGLPCSNLGRTSQWAPGQPVQDHALLRLADEVPPGTYRVLAGFYDPATGDRLGGQALQVGTVVVR